MNPQILNEHVTGETKRKLERQREERERDVLDKIERNKLKQDWARHPITKELLTKLRTGRENLTKKLGAIKPEDLADINAQARVYNEMDSFLLSLMETE